MYAGPGSPPAPGGRGRAGAMRTVADFPARRARWPALLVFLLALGLRLAHVLFLSRSPYFTHPVLDAETYHEAALALVRGLGYPDRVFWQPPGYP